MPMPTLCAECAKYYENEASVVRAKAAGTNLALTFFPGWPQADEPQTSHKVPSVINRTHTLASADENLGRICSLNSNDVIHIQGHFSHRLIDAG